MKKKLLIVLAAAMAISLAGERERELSYDDDDDDDGEDWQLDQLGRDVRSTPSTIRRRTASNRFSGFYV